MTDDVQRRARRQARIATYTESEDRHRKAIALHPEAVPTIEQLVSGAALSGCSVAVDARRWGARLLQSPDGGRIADDVADAVARFVNDPTAEAAEDLEHRALERIAAFEPDISVEDLYGDIADRCTLYGAWLGNPAAAGRAVAIVHDALHSYIHVAGGDPVPLREVAVTLLQFASLCRRDLPSHHVDPLLEPSWPIVRGNARTLMATLATVAAPPEAIPEGNAPAAPAPTSRAAEPGDVAALEEAAAPGLVVIKTPPGGKKIAGHAGTLAGVRLPLRPLPDLESLGRELTARRPWAAPAIARVIGLMLGRPYASLPNIVLVGPPGCGKSELARDLATALGDRPPRGGPSAKLVHGGPLRYR